MTVNDWYEISFFNFNKYLSPKKKREIQINEHTSEMERLRINEQARGLSDDGKNEVFQTEIKNRDERINQLKYELENVIQLKNKEIDALSQKMLSVMDEKDHQIKVLLF